MELVDQQDFPDLYDVYNQNRRHWGKFGKPDSICNSNSIYFKQEIISKKLFILVYTNPDFIHNSVATKEFNKSSYRPYPINEEAYFKLKDLNYNKKCDDIYKPNDLNKPL